MDCNLKQPQTLDATYVNNWLGESDAIHDLSIDNILKFKKIVTYYAKVIAPHKKVRITFSGDIEKYEGYTVVEVPYSLIEEGRLDEAVGVVMHKLRTCESAEPGIGGYSVAWDVFRLFMESCTLNINGSKRVAWDVFTESCSRMGYETHLVKDEYAASTAFSDYSLGRVLSGINSNNGCKAMFMQEFIIDCMSDINLIVKAVNEVRLDVSSPLSIKKYIAKHIDSSWKSYSAEKHAYPAIARSIMDFKFFFYNKHTDYKCARGINKKDLRRCSAKRLVKMAVEGFKDELNTRLIGRLEMFLSNLDKYYYLETSSKFKASEYYETADEGYSSSYNYDDFAKSLRNKENKELHESSYRGHRVKTTSKSTDDIVWGDVEVNWLGEFEKDSEKDESFTREDSILESLGYYYKSKSEASSNMIKELASLYIDKPYEIHWTDISLAQGVVTFPTVVIDTYKIKN